MPDVGDPVTLTLTVDPFTATTAVTVAVGAPSGALQTPTAATVDGGRTWTAPLTLTEPGAWQVRWTVTGAGAGVGHDTVYAYPAPAVRDLTLATLHDLTLYTGRAATEPGRAAALLEAAAGAVRDYCGWHLHAVTGRTVVLDADGGTVLTLPCLHVTTVSEVRIDGAVVTDWTPSASGMLRRHTGWPNRFGAVQVTYSGGYAPVPAQVVAAVCSVADRALARPPGGLMQSETIGDYTYRLSPLANDGLVLLTDGEQSVLDRYRILDDHEPVGL